jgi:hypothetical protein
VIESTRPRCLGTKKNGEPCLGWRLPASDFCFTHSLTPEQVRAKAAKGGKARAARVRAEKGVRPRSGLVPSLTLSDVLKVATEGLRATFADAGLPGQIDWSTRLLSCLVVLHTFPEYLRQKPEDARQLIEDALPARVAPDAARIDVQEMYTLARREWDKTRIRATKLGKLYTEPYPSALVAPWERIEDVRKEAPDLSHLEVKRTLDGQTYIEKPDEVGLLIEVDA